MATNTAGNTGKRYEQDQTHYLAKTVTYATLNSTGTGTGTGNAVVTVGWLPANAIVVRGYTKIVTGFNDTTGDDLDIGVEGDDDDLFASAVDMNSTATTAFDDLATANDYSTSARKVTCNFTTAPTGDGTTGKAIVVVEYIVPRDA